MIDNDLPYLLARGIAPIVEADGDEVASLRDKFGRTNLTDKEWIEELGEEGRWAVISADMRIAKKRPSRDLFLRHGLVGFFLAPSLQKSSLSLQASRLLFLWSEIRDQHRLNRNGCFEVPQRGRQFRSIGR